MHPSILDGYNDSPIAFNRHYVTIGCGINGALMLTQAVYWSKRAKRDGLWFYKTQAEWEEETGMTRREQETARKRLVELGVMEEKRAGVPAKMYYRVDVVRVHELLIEALDLAADQDCTKQPIQYGGKRQSSMPVSANLLYTENTTKTTTEITTSIDSAFEIFYQAGMRKLNKKAALKAFAKQVKERKVCPTEFANMLADDVRKRVAAQQMGFDAMHPTTYLNNERWEDEIVQRQEQQASPAKQFDNWYASDAGIDRKAKELGITPRATESYRDLKDRIQAHLKAGQRSTYQQDAQTTIYQELNDDDIPY